jgi:hypothetical protein
LNGASGAGNSTATQEINIPKAGVWRIWVRYMVHSAYRGPFQVDILSGEKVLFSHAFDVDYNPDTPSWNYRWDSFDADLTPGKYTLRLSKYQNKNCSGYTRNIDCFLLTTDLEQKPDYVPFGPQTWMKVTLGTGYAHPVQIHIFADHYRSPWYAHYAISKDGVENALNPTRKEALLSDGESTGWVNISRMIYQDSGAHLVMYPAYSYNSYNDRSSPLGKPPRFNATIQFANRSSDAAVVKTFTVDYSPSTMHIVMPPNLDTPDNIARLRSDKDFAEEYGKIADNFNWPKAGKNPVKFPFFVTATLDPDTMDAGVVDRALKTLSQFGFNGIASSSAFEKYGFHYKYIGGAGWYTKGSYSAPDLEKIQKSADALYQSQIAAGIAPQDIAFAMVMDEPAGEPLTKIAKDAASIEGFRNWLKGLNLTPQDLLVNSWDDVKIVTDADKSTFPALYYYSEKYRTIALGNFLAIQKKQLHDHWKSTFPVLTNFSDGAVYYANFYGQGVDYFTLLHDTDQNAIWSEDWSNGSSTYQDATYNVELMRAAARKNGQTIGQYLIAYAGRKGYDIRLKAVSEAARGVKIFKSYSYGPFWAQHEPSAWQKNTSIWSDQAAAVREIGAVEDYLLPAMPKKAQVAILYSSASDIWNQKNLVYGFERMNTWLALTHAQIPVDVMGEDEVAGGFLNGYKVCYLSDPNITRAAAIKLRDWVQAGGTLIMTAGAGEFDEYNRPLDVLNQLLSYQRTPVKTFQNYNSSGYYLTTLLPKDTVTAGNTTIDVLGVKQTFDGVGNQVEIKSTFADGSPAEIRGAAGKGVVLCKGYLPAIDYMRKTLITNNGVRALSKTLNDNNGIPGPDDVLPLELNKKSSNPWQYPADIRNAIIAPVQTANVDLPITCNIPLVDAVYMTSAKGIVIPLANYTLQPIKEMTLDIEVDKPFHEVRSVYQGVLKYEKIGNNKIRVHLPLDCTDFVTIEY